MTQKLTAKDMAQIAVVAAIYVVLTVTPPINVLSYGPYQFRISEMMNFTAFYHKKYIIGVTLDCMIANMANSWLDVIVGSLSTLVFLSLGVKLFERYKQETVFGVFNKAYLYFSIFFSLSMFTIAAELVYLYQVPFFWTWLTVGLGEFASLLVGGLIMDKLGKRLPL